MVTSLGDDVWWYDLGGVNAYLARDGDAVTLIDAGTPLHRRDILGGLSERGFSPKDVDRVLVTHFDVDHVGTLRRLSGLDATVYIGQHDAGYLTGAARPNWRNHKGALQAVTQPLVRTGKLNVEPLADGETVGSFTAIHTPGHTPGHVVYVSEALSLCCLGDLVQESDGQLTPSPWLMSYDTDAVRRSIREVARRAPPFEIAAMGHGTPFNTRGSERLSALVDRL